MLGRISSLHELVTKTTVQAEFYLALNSNKFLNFNTEMINKKEYDNFEHIIAFNLNIHLGRYKFNKNIR